MLSPRYKQLILLIPVLLLLLQFQVHADNKKGDIDFSYSLEETVSIDMPGEEGTYYSELEPHEGLFNLRNIQKKMFAALCQHPAISFLAEKIRSKECRIPSGDQSSFLYIIYRQLIL